MNILYVNSLEANNKELARQLASANVLIAEQNKLAKERQEWALHTNEVIRSLNQQLAEALAACKMKDEALRWIAGQPASGAIQCRATEAIAIHSDDEALEQLASTALEQAAKICEGQTEGFGSTSVWDSSALSCAEAIRAIKELP